MRIRFLVLVTVFALASVSFAQNKKVFDPHDLSGYWELTNIGRPAGALNTISNNRPAMTECGKTVFNKTNTGYKELSTVVFPQKDCNDHALWCDPLGFPCILCNTQFPAIRLTPSRD